MRKGAYATSKCEKAKEVKETKKLIFGLILFWLSPAKSALGLAVPPSLEGLWHPSGQLVSNTSGD